jgi:hypothetical protein
MNRVNRESKAFLPTLHDIRQACDKIQENWSEWERRKRSGGIEKPHWLPPFVEVDLLFHDVFPDSY